MLPPQPPRRRRAPLPIPTGLAGLAGLAAVMLLAGCAPKPRPDLVLITVDTLRPDALGYVAGKNATPAIDALAAAGFRFETAVSPAPLTLPSHTSILTGLNPRRHGVRDNGQVLAASVPTLAEKLAAAGYRTGAFISGYPLRRMFGLGRGFEKYQDELASRPDGRWQDRPADATTALALEWLRGVKKKDPHQPFFLWIHYYDPHAPYEPPARFLRPGERGAYDGEVAAVDHAVGFLQQSLEEAFPGRPRLLALTADHGEGLGEHGEATHGFFVYESTTVVPLLFHAPGLLAPGKSLEPARLIDLAPTLLAQAGLAPLPDVDGVDLSPLFGGGRLELPPALIETRLPFYGYGWSPLTAWRTTGHKWIEAPRPELYDLRRDPAEQHDLSKVDERGQKLRRELAAELRKKPLATAGVSDDPEVAAALRSLGYAGGSAVAADPEAAGALADPKDRIRQKNLLDLAEDSLSAGETVDALALFDVVLEAEPGNRYALLRSGQTLAQAGQWPEAIAKLGQLLALDPGQNEARFELADALGRSGRPAEAIQQWLQLLERQPGRAIAWSNLGALLLRQGEADKAEAALEKAYELESHNPVGRGNLAECRYLAAIAAHAGHDEKKAAAKLAAAVELVPELRLRAASDPRLQGLAGSPGKVN